MLLIAASMRLSTSLKAVQKRSLKSADERMSILAQVRQTPSWPRMWANFSLL